MKHILHSQCNKGCRGTDSDLLAADFSAFAWWPACAEARISSLPSEHFCDRRLWLLWYDTRPYWSFQQTNKQTNLLLHFMYFLFFFFSEFWWLINIATIYSTHTHTRRGEGAFAVHGFRDLCANMCEDQVWQWQDPVLPHPTPQASVKCQPLSPPPNNLFCAFQLSLDESWNF